MNLELTDEQSTLRDTVRQFLAERASVAAHVRPMLEDPTGTTDDVWRGLAELGATGLLVPPEYDGAGMTMVEAGIVAEELGAALHPGPWLSCAVAAPRALQRMGADGTAASLLAGIADGSMIVTVGPLAGPRPTAVERGPGVALRGTVASVPDVAAADVLLVLADDSDGTALFAVQTSSVGVAATPEVGVDPTRKQFRVTLEDAPAQRLASASAEAVEALVDDVLAAYAADALGAAQAVMNQAVEYAKVRRQFGQPIGSFQAVQHLCVDMYETVRARPRRRPARALGRRRGRARGAAPRGRARKSVRGAAGDRRRHRDPGSWRRGLHLGAQRTPLPQAPAELERFPWWTRSVRHRGRLSPGAARARMMADHVI